MRRLVILFFILAVSVVGYSNVSATNNDWINDAVYISNAGDSHIHSCLLTETNGILGYDGEVYSANSYGCRLHAKDIDFLFGSYMSTWGLYGVINPKDGDDLFRPISVANGRKLYFSDLAKVLLEVDSRREDGKRVLRVYDDPASNIFPTSSINGKNVAYGVTDFAQHSYTLDWPITYPGISENGRYLMATYWDGESNILVKIDTETNEIKRFKIDHNTGINYRIFTVSNNGRYTVLEGKVYDTEACDAVKNGYSENCGYRALKLTDIPSSSIPNYASVTDFRFGSDNYNIFASLALGAPGLTKRVEAAEYSLIPRLDYLALGDSYSSGEGDIGTKSNGSSYYLPGTTNAEECHLSSRSYPFLLRDKWGISSSGMKSVACSGAKVLPDYYGNPTNYIGQGGRLGDLSEDNRAIKQKSAIDEFRPGEIQQVEFVKKYRPKVVTFTAGGNDVGFADIIKYCASPTWQAFTMVDDTCGYAVKGSELNKMLYSSIDTQYFVNKELISKLKDASPSTRIVVVGYPSFISPETAVCGLNGGALDSDERRMIDNGITYMNGMLKQLAVDERVSYVDIQNALNGGRICEGAQYVTDITDVKFDKDNFSETFHPNAAGHEKIANKIYASGVYGEDNVPQGGLYMPPSLRLSRSVDLIKGGSLIRGELTAVKLAAQSFTPGSRVSVTTYSKPTSMGDFVAAGDGSIDTNIDTTVLAPGRHLIVASGLSPEGVQADYFQFIDVGYSSEDMDGDGVSDDVDRCQYIVAWYDEVSGRDVCQATSTGGLTYSNSSDDQYSKGSSEVSLVNTQNLANKSLGYAITPLAIPSVAGIEERSKLAQREGSKVDLRVIGIGGILLLGGIIFGYTCKRRKNAKR